MSFAWPLLLWLLVLPAALLGWELTRRRRSATTAQPKILQGQAVGGEVRLSAAPALRRAGARVWLCAGLAAVIVAGARPQWGRLEEPVFDQAREILLAIDLSRSMLTPDVKPSRLERAKLLVQSLLEKLAGERVGLVVFSGTAFLQSPLSADYEILREFLPALNPAFLPQGGTNYRALLDTSLEAFGAAGAADRFLVVLSDGEATDEDWRERVEPLRKKGVRVIGLGLGTAAGAMIPDEGGGFVKDDRGAVVLSKLESATLQELARETQGTYRDASAWIDLADLVRETVARGRRGDFVEKNTVRLVERFQWPLALGLWCLLVSFWYEFPVRPRVRDLRMANALRGTKGVALLLLAALPALLFSPSPARAAATLANPTKPEPREDAGELARLVGRLAGSPERRARDWADLGRETVTWGSRLQSQQQPVPEGPIQDALDAVKLGSALDAKAADWPKLREELEALLRKPEEPPKQDDKKQDQPKNEDQKQDQNQDQSESKSSDQKSSDQKSQPQEKQDQKQDSQSKSDSGQPDPKDAKQSPGEPKPSEDQELGDMKKQEAPPPPPPWETRKVGGAPEKKESAEPVDPALALPLQKLDQIRNQDSPAELFQMLRRDRVPTKKTGKDW